MCTVNAVAAPVGEGRLGATETARAQLPALRERLRLFTTGTCRARLLRYIAAASKARDVVAECKLHALHALIFAHSPPGGMDADAIGAFMSSCSFVMSWHSQADGCGVPEPSTQKRSRYFYYYNEPKDAVCKADGATPGLPLAAVFHALQRQRRHVMYWLQRAASSDVDDFLTRVTGVTLRKQRMRAQQDWQVASKEQHRCRMTLQSAHPCRPGTDMYTTVSFPGASYIALYFDPECSLELDHDYVTLYKDESCGAFWGEERITGSATEGGWPGAGGRPPLTIPTDHFVLHFHTDTENEEWGFKLVAVAPVNARIVTKLSQEPRPGAGPAATWPVGHCQKAVAACNNVEADARDYLTQHADRLDMEAAQEAAAAAAASEAAAAGDAVVREVNGLFRDPPGVVEVNVQSAEVGQRSHCRKCPPAPTPNATPS